MTTLEQFRQNLAQFQHRAGEAVVIVPPFRVNWPCCPDRMEVWFAGHWHELRAEYVTGAGSDLALIARPSEQHKKLWEKAVAASKLAPFDATALALELILPSGLRITVSCNQEDALWGDSGTPSREKNRDSECGHKWRVFGHGIQEASLLVRCPQCSTVGKVTDPSAEEEARIRNGSSDPYLWPDNSRVEVLQAGSRCRRVRCDDCGCPGMHLAESLSPGGILETEGNCPQCGYQYSVMEHIHKGSGSFWENWPVKAPVQAGEIEHTFERLLCQVHEQIKEAKERAIQRASGVLVPVADKKNGGLGPAAVPTLDLSSDPEFMAELDKLENE